jgi:ribosomal protein L40E
MSHPHIHFIIPAGSFNKTQQHWEKNKGKYLFNAFNLAKVWRARLLEHLTQQPTITLPAQLSKKWVVDCQHVGKGLPALQYLSRYLYRGVLPDKNIERDVDGLISFEYEDSQSKSTKIRTLPATEFLWLVLQHVLPKGLRRVRDSCNKQWIAQRQCQKTQATNTAYAGGCRGCVSNHSRDKAQISDSQLPMLPATNALYGRTKTTDKLNTHNLTLKMIIRIMA